MSLAQRYERHENQMNRYAAELEVNDWQMIAWTSWSCDTVKGRRGMTDDRPVCNALKVNVASLNLIRHSMGSQWSCDVTSRAVVQIDVSIYFVCTIYTQREKDLVQESRNTFFYKSQCV